MKKLSLVLLVSLLAFACKDNAASKVNQDNVDKAAERDLAALDLPKIAFDKEEHDFGNITNGSAVETTFTYTNTGNSPLVVSDIKSTCGCTIPKKPEKPIMPGESDKIQVKYDTKRVGFIRKSITVTSNASNPNVILKITGQVMSDNKKTGLEKKKKSIVEDY